MEDFIGIYENALDYQDCDKFISYFQKLQSLNLTYTRQQANDALAHQKEDESAFLMQEEVFIRQDNPINNLFLDKVWYFYNLYTEKYSILRDSHKHGIQNIKIQKTLPGQGYHVWHYETSMKLTCTRLIAFSIYLNNVDEGGETEFLYMKKRIKAEKGKLLFWPGAFTHTHRGNPPLSGEKYLLTGWLEFV